MAFRVHQAFSEPRQKRFGDKKAGLQGAEAGANLAPSKPMPIPNGQGARVGES